MPPAASVGCAVPIAILSSCVSWAVLACTLLQKPLPQIACYSPAASLVCCGYFEKRTINAVAIPCRVLIRITNWRRALSSVDNIYSRILRALHTTSVIINILISYTYYNLARYRIYRISKLAKGTVHASAIFSKHLLGAACVSDTLSAIILDPGERWAIFALTSYLEQLPSVADSLYTELFCIIRVVILWACLATTAECLNLTRVTVISYCAISYSSLEGY